MCGHVVLEDASDFGEEVECRAPYQHTGPSGVGADAVEGGELTPRASLRGVDARPCDRLVAVPLGK